MDIGTIEKMTKDYADARGTLSGRVTEMNEAIDLIKRRYLPLIKHAVNSALDRKSKLQAEIENHPELFEKPRTLTLHGIKVGFQKQRAGIDWNDDEAVVKLIRKHFPDQVDVLVKTTEKPVKSALNQLTVADLKKLGVSVSDGADEAVIKPTDTDVDKLVAKLLEDEPQAA
ncbi:MAG TPA: host-nuclease inhibitor Gam family protein [Candidatus Ozemobacteraceae bacterium]|nr:host-nuclease inhibitor Gam family protein [Candidatus Ozemobacteraceae bacterium]